MAKKIVEYEIEPSGNCLKCKCKNIVSEKVIAFYMDTYYCMAFENCYIGRNALLQCQACKDFLAKEASKVYCDGCIHYKYNQFTQEIYCTKLKLFKRENPLNCKSKEQV